MRTIPCMVLFVPKWLTFGLLHMESPIIPQNEDPASLITNKRLKKKCFLAENRSSFRSSYGFQESIFCDNIQNLVWGKLGT